VVAAKDAAETEGDPDAQALETPDPFTFKQPQDSQIVQHSGAT